MKVWLNIRGLSLSQCLTYCHIPDKPTLRAWVNRSKTAMIASVMPAPILNYGAACRSLTDLSLADPGPMAYIRADRRRQHEFVRKCFASLFPHPEGSRERPAKLMAAGSAISTLPAARLPELAEEHAL